MPVNLNEWLSDQLGIVGAIDPQNVVDTEVFTDYIDMAAMEQAVGTLMSGNLSAHTVDFRAVAYSDTAAGDATELKDITQLAAHAADNDNKQAQICVRREDLLNKQTGSVVLRYVRFGVVSEAGQTGYVAVLAQGGGFRFGNGADNDLDSVVEIETDLN